MPSVEEVLSDAQVKQFLESNQNAAQRVKRAAEFLKDHADCADALKKLLPTLAEQVIRVFFSYKKKDERTANAIVEVLRECAGERLAITYQGEFTADIAGKVWRQTISQAVRSANWFILLVPDPSEDLDWCLFETGLFEAQLTSADRLICLHHPDTEVPSPIEGYHAISATLPEMEKFLRMVLVMDNPVPGFSPINRALEPNITALARRIVDAIRIPRGRMNRVVFEPWIEISLDGITSFANADDLDMAAVVSANKEALDLFGLLECKPNFGLLREGIEERDSDGRWRNELFHVVRKISNGRKFFPVQAVFQSHTGSMYRPVALAVDRAGPSGPIQTYHITFAEDVSTADTAAMPARLAMLATLLRFTFRFHWEVLQPFCTRPLSKQEIAKLDISLRRIQVDWQSRGTVSAASIPELFVGDDAEQVRQMLAKWRLLRNENGTGELDKAIDAVDGARIAAILASFLPANEAFLRIAADRFAQMLGQSDDARAAV